MQLLPCRVCSFVILFYYVTVEKLGIFMLSVKLRDQFFTFDQRGHVDTVKCVTPTVDTDSLMSSC
jgi:hypothetical protein